MLVAAQRRAMLPVFGGISGSTNATVIIDFNTTNDSWWMFHFQPTTKTHSTFEYHQRQLVDVSLPTYNKHPLHFRIPPTTVGGLFNSSLSNNKKKRRASLEGLVVSFARPRGPQKFLCAGGRYVL